MKLVVALCLVAVVAAAPPTTRIDYPSGNVGILKYEADLGYGSYNYAFEQTDGTKAEQSGRLINEGTNEEHLEVSGVFQWVGPDGVTYIVRYTAGQEGYKPEIEQGPGGGVPAHVATLLG